MPDLTTAEYRRFLRRVADLDWHVHINVDAHALQVPVESIQAAGVKLVVDHFGHPDSTRGADCAGFQALLRAVERGRTWVKLSAGYRLAVPEVGVTYAQALLKHAGPERLLWGSDWPFAAFESKVSYRETLEAFARWVPDAAQRRIIGGETPLALYFS